jgi:phosphomannomutase / phosphoglucomutase
MIYSIPESPEHEVFRTYDIRGKVKFLTTDLVYAVGRALAVEIIATGDKRVVSARDGRLSSPSLHPALLQGLADGGCDVVDAGLLPTPLLYFATVAWSIPSGIMLTGSHNPKDYNGIKMVVGGVTLSSDRVQAIYQRILRNDMPCPGGNITERAGIVDEYLAYVTERVKLDRPLKIAVDCGNGAGGVVAKQLYEALGCEVTALFTEVDGNFPNHHPDPAEPENVQDLIKTVVAQNADCGLAFDGDADRLGLVTNSGDLIWPDRQMMLFAQDVLQRNPGADIVFDVKCSRYLAEVIERAGGKPVMWKTGHSLLKAKMYELGSPLAGEMSGHIFFRDGWTGFDDGLYAGARLLEILARNPASLDDIFAVLPNSVVTPEIKIPIAESDKQAVMSAVTDLADFPDGEKFTLDGLRVDFADGFLLLRPSNTTPYLIARFESSTESGLNSSMQRLKELLNSAAPHIECPF